MNYLTRDQWGATFDVSPIELIRLPVSLLFVHHNVIPPTDDPAYDMERTERADIARFGKPSYDQAIHPSGVVLEGMTNHLSPDTYGHNSDSLSIMFMGDFRTDQPTDAAMHSGRELVQRLRDIQWITSYVQVKGHRDVYPTVCPGDNLYTRIQELLIPIVQPPVPIPPQRTKMLLFLITGDQDPTGQWYITDYMKKWKIVGDENSVQPLLEVINHDLSQSGGAFAADTTTGKYRPYTRPQMLVDQIPNG